MAVFTFFVFDQKCPFLVNLVQNVKIVSLRWYLIRKSNSNMQNSMMLFTFFVFDCKYPFCANLVQNVKIISLSWNLVPRLILIWRIQWWCSLFFVFDWKYPFRGKFRPKSQNYQFKVGLSLSKQKCVIYFIESHLNMRKMLFISS